MKRLITLCFLANLFFSNLSATHVTGGDLTYRYIGDSTSIPHHYQIQLRLLRDKNASLNHPSAVSVQVSSACYSNQNLTLQRIATINQTISGVCFDPNSIDTNRIETHIYRNTLVLPGICSNYIIRYNLCCRNSTDNLVGEPVFELRATLNNIIGPVSSLEFGDEAELWGCVGRENEWPLSFNKRNNDSVHFSFTPIIQSNAVTVSYQSGFSWQDPISVNQGTFSSIDPQTALLTYEPDIVQYSMVAIKATQIRLDSNINTYVEVSTVTKEFPLIVYGACDTTIQGASMNSDNLLCGDTTLKILFDMPIMKNTLSTNNSEFLLYGPDNFVVPIVGSTSNTPATQLTFEELEFQLQYPIYLNGSYYLQTRIGDDLDVLKSLCGYSIPAGDTLAFLVEDSNCENINVAEWQMQPKIVVFPNPAKEAVFVKMESVGEKTIKVTDLSGKTLYQTQTTEKEHQIDLRHLPSGFYIVQVLIEGFSGQHFKIIKE